MGATMAAAVSNENTGLRYMLQAALYEKRQEGIHRKKEEQKRIIKTSGNNFTDINLTCLVAWGPTYPIRLKGREARPRNRILSQKQNKAHPMHWHADKRTNTRVIWNFFHSSFFAEAWREGSSQLVARKGCLFGRHVHQSDRTEMTGQRWQRRLLFSTNYV